MLSDLRLAIRSLARAPGFLAAAVLTLALGIGANTAVFSVVNAAFLRPLPLRDPSSVVRLYTSQGGDGRVSERRFGASSLDDYEDLARQTRVFDGLATETSADLRLDTRGDPVRLRGRAVSANYFAVLGVRTVLGRGFSPDADAPDASPEVVLSHALWAGRFAGDSSVVGRTISLGRHAFTVVGVAHPSFAGTEFAAAPEAWVPVRTWRRVTLDLVGLADTRGARSMDVIGRLRAGVTVEQAQAAMDVAARQLAAAHPETNANRVFTLTSDVTLLGAAERENFGGVVAAAVVLQVIVALVLAVACANVGNLLLVRAERRRREFAVRLTLGATRSRLARALLVESGVVALLGAAAGLVAASWSTELLRVVPVRTPLDLSVDWRVAGAALALAALTTIALGLVPMAYVARGDLSPAVKDGAAVSGYRRSRLRDGLVVAQMAASLFLLTGAALALRSMYENRDGSTGYDSSHVLVVSVELLGVPLAPGYSEQLLAETAERMRALPSVRSVSAAEGVMMSGSVMRQPVTVPGRQPPPGEDREVSFDRVWPRFFETIGLPVVRGRGIGPADVEGAPAVAVVNESMARRYWPGGDAVGQRLMVSGEPHEVVGVVPDAANSGPMVESQPHFYLAGPQAGWPLPALYVRTDGDPALVAAAALAIVRDVKRAVAPDAALEARPLDDVRRDSMLPNVVSTAFLSLFGGLALLLALVGLYGVTSYAVAVRTREIGVRIALGASAGPVVRLVMRRTMKLALVGGGAGLSLATLLLVAVARGQNVSVPPSLVGTLVALSLTLAGVAALASWLPARRAARVDPVVALRTE